MLCNPTYFRSILEFNSSKRAHLKKKSQISKFVLTSVKDLETRDSDACGVKLLNGCAVQSCQQKDWKWNTALLCAIVSQHVSCILLFLVCWRALTRLEISFIVDTVNLQLLSEHFILFFSFKLYSLLKTFRKMSSASRLYWLNG